MPRNAADSCDLIVIGGGPGGSALATFVAMHGNRVVLLEKEEFPRYQIGESLLPSTVHSICSLLGISEEIKNANFWLKPGATFRWGKNPELWSFRFKLPQTPEALGYSYQVERSKFDAILLNNARRKGVEVRMRQTCTEIIKEDGRAVGVIYQDENGNEGRLNARYVADASGNTTRISRAVGERIYSDFFRNVAVFGYFENAKRLPAPNQGNSLHVAFKDGWFWYIPLSETLTSVGAVVARDSLEADTFAQGTESAYDGFIDACPIIKDHVSTGTRIREGRYGQVRIRKDYSYANTRFWSPGMVLVGDAACFVDPIFSSGVHLATYSGLLAARSINSCLDKKFSEERCFEEFERRYRREFNHFYQFNIAFYDMNRDEDSYYWHARSVLNTEERANDAFVTLVSGSAAEQFFDQRIGIGQVLQKHSEGEKDPITAANFDKSKLDLIKVAEGLAEGRFEIDRLAGLRPQVEQKPVFEAGLLASADGLSWEEAPIMVSAGD
jgi:halogenation protein CepH